ncbi:PAX-interacting protein 1 isoform A [Glycine soja]|uniref:PAX-interacting protein 1 isoform A n=1 Tax=Glycine soja TaxID=3848 RepID=A0A445I8E1_GLYSO|nr:PAX-interacting protein 1 isoform A [Glycine soja]
MSPIDSTGNGDRKIHQDFDFVDTQPFDADGEEDDVCGFFEDTVPFGDDGVLETEAVNLAGETQALDDGDAFDDDDDGVLETEAVNLAGETQALDDGDTQLLEEESDSDRTQVLENVDDDDVDEVSVGNVNAEAVDSKKGESSQQNSSGSMPPRFTVLRAESLRQAALACNMDLKETQDVTNSVEGTSQFCQVPQAVKDNGGSFLRCSEKDDGVDQENKHRKYSVEVGGFKSKSMCKVANSTVRKLFNDVLPVETNQPSLRSNDFNEGDDLDKLPIYHDELTGLSYVESQEPGVLSQDNALDFVDRFLKDNTLEFDQETNSVKKIEEKSKSIPSTKRQHSLAKTVNDRGKSGRTGIYDWDDNREDEGGGDIFLRRKEDFFKGEMHRPRSLPGFQKSKVCRLNDDKEDKKQLSIPNRRKTAVHSDSKLGMHILKARDNIIPEATMLKRNLANELDEQFNTDCSRGEMEPNANACAPEMLDVGLDTQMAAEAMEALCNVGDIVDHVANDATHVTRSGLMYKVNNSSTGKVGSGSSKERLGQYDKKRKVDVKSKLQTSGLSKKSTKEVRQWTKDNMMTRSKRSKLNAEGNQTSSANENGRVSLSPIIAQRKSAGALKRHQLDELNNPGGNNGESRGSSVGKRHLQDDVLLFTPIARRTRRSLAVNPLINVSDDAEMDTLDCPKGRRSLRIRKLSNDDKRSETLVGSSKPSAQPEDIGKHTAGKRKMRTDSVVKSHVNCQARSSLSLYDGSAISSVDRKQGKISELNSDKANPGDNINNSEVTTLDESPRERYKSSDLASATPAKCKTPANDASPVCMGDEYYKQSCNRNLSRSCKELHRELQSLRDIRSELLTPSKDSRKRRDMTDVRILYSHHLDEDIVKHQKKILARLGVSVASSIADATHFIANQFVRTRNMLEAIAFGKPVVTHLWIESCGQASCFIDERNYILRDVKKEKELGFSMPVSLAHAIQHPLLKGRRVLVTTNTKPSKEIVSNLTRAVQGQVVEKVGRSVFKGDTISDDLLILSCEEDYASCVPFLEKGAMVYSSELLLNGIVTQKLEYQRHRLFADIVKKTRSTLWLKTDDRTFIPVTKFCTLLRQCCDNCDL